MSAINITWPKGLRPVPQILFNKVLIYNERAWQAFRPHTQLLGHYSDYKVVSQGFKNKSIPCKEAGFLSFPKEPLKACAEYSFTTFICDCPIQGSYICYPPCSIHYHSCSCAIVVLKKGSPLRPLLGKLSQDC